jgi:hypothetical protein
MQEEINIKIWHGKKFPTDEHLEQERKEWQEIKKQWIK